MKKRKIQVIAIVFCILILGVVACSSHETRIDAKYVSIYDDYYLIFKKDGSIKSNAWTTLKGGKEVERDCFIYKIDENSIITAIDTTEYEGQDSLTEYELGILYKDYICPRWEGTMSKKYGDMTLINKLDENFILTFYLEKDKTYQYTITTNGDEIETERGTYTIKKNEIICTSDEGKKTTFINIDGNTYCIEYVKE